MDFEILRLGTWETWDSFGQKFGVFHLPGRFPEGDWDGPFQQLLIMGVEPSGIDRNGSHGETKNWMVNQQLVVD